MFTVKLVRSMRLLFDGEHEIECSTQQYGHVFIHTFRRDPTSASTSASQRCAVYESRQVLPLTIHSGMHLAWNLSPSIVLCVVRNCVVVSLPPRSCASEIHFTFFHAPMIDSHMTLCCLSKHFSFVSLGSAMQFAFDVVCCVVNQKDGDRCASRGCFYLIKRDGSMEDND